MEDDPSPDDASAGLVAKLPTQPALGLGGQKSVKDCSTSLAGGGDGSMRASDLDLRKTKGELFSKLIERQPQQMIFTTTLNRRSSDENLNSSASFKGLNRLEFSCQPGQKARPASIDQHQLQQHADLAGKQQTLVTISRQFDTSRQQNLLATQDPPLFARVRSRWYTNEEVASILTSFNDHPEWQSNELQMRPKSGAVLLYSREKVRYRQDGYCWKKRKNGRTTREDHMKLKVQGVECIYGCYVHSALLPTFHRRCYWLLENPDIVLVHYLNQPPDDKNKMILTLNSGLLEADTKRKWTNEEIVEEIGAVFGGISQINRTLSINFPASDSTFHAVVGGAGNSNGLNPATNVPIEIDAGGQNVAATRLGGAAAVGSGAGGNSDFGMVIISGNEAQGPSSTMNAADEQSADSDAGSEDDDEMQASNQDEDGQSGEVAPSASRSGGGANMNARLDIKYDLDQSKDLAGNTAQCGAQNSMLRMDEFDSSSFCDQPEKSANTETSSGHHLRQTSGPCSPVTQIYNKIVEDIETYAIPFELDQFAPNHHQPLQHQDSAEMQSMDTSEPDQQSSPQNINERSYHSMQRDGSAPSEQHLYAEDQLDRADCDPVQLIACDLFVNCGGLTGTEQNEDSERANGSAINHDEMGANVEEILGCQDPTDPLDLFNFKPLNCNSLQPHHLLLDVKSTTSETETMDRLSPVGAGRQPPRCNSSDNAIQLSSQRVDQYLHHSSIHFLADTSNSQANVDERQLMSNFLAYRDQQQNNAGLVIDGANAHRSNTSTEQSNSTSTSSLLNATSGHAGGETSFTSNQSADQGLPSSIGSAYNDSSTTSSSFIKLPLPQRQNSEQKEPSNSILSSLLPKALSLDGSDLSSTAQFTNQQNHHHNNHRHQHHHHHHQRTSPLVGPYHLSGAHHVKGVQAAAYEHQAGMQMRLVPPSLAAHQRSNRHHYQRPSAPNISSGSSASHGLLPILDYVPNWSTTSGGTKILIIGGWTSLVGGDAHQEQKAMNDDSALMDDDRRLMSSDAQQKKSSDASFYVMFDELLAPANLIQDNVLRCYSPCHKPGLVALRIVYRNSIVSEQVLFEIRSDNTAKESLLSQSATVTTSVGFEHDTSSAN